MRVLVDTNIILDLALKRMPFYLDAQRLFNEHTNLNVELFLTATTITDIYYIIRKEKDRSIAIAFVDALLKFVNVASVDKRVVMQALQANLKDFEDAIQVSSANYAHINIIVTRNERDFQNSGLQLFSPASFLETFNQ